MPTITYNKAVRDQVPSIIRASGKECVVEQVPAYEFLALLKEKLSEEVAEYQAKPSLEELADIVEVVRAILTLSGSTWEQLEEERVRKVTERGGFLERLVLRTVESN